jgi:hypothetical protein
MPRRVLAITISNYLYFNPVSYGPRGRDAHSLVTKLARGLEVQPTQVFELSDAAPNPPGPRPPLKPVVLKAMEDFAATSRAQDRIVLLFTGHAVDIDGEAFLVPLDGEPGVKETLIPLARIFELLATCKARQKILILDVCRFDPARGSERPSSGAMTEAFEAVLAKPPAGVQVWSACSAGEYSYEENGLFNSGLFASALVDGLTPGTRDRRLELPARPRTIDSIPIAAIRAKVGRWTATDANTYMKRKQTPQLHGSENEAGAVYNPAESAAVAVQFPKVDSDFFAPREMIQAILRETSQIPPVKAPAAGMQPLRAETFPAFTTKVMKEYAVVASPLQAAVKKAIAALVEHQGAFQDTFANRNIAQLKVEAKAKQEKLAATQDELAAALAELNGVAEDRKNEPSKRWQAMYDYVKARLLMRLAYVFEYQYMLAEIRTDSLPELQPNHIGWRLASREKMQCKGDPGKEAKDRARQARDLLDAIARDHKGTPYEILAKREMVTALGLEWQPLMGPGKN